MAENEAARPPETDEPGARLATNESTTVAAGTDVRPDRDTRRVVVEVVDPDGLAALLEAVAHLAPPRAAERLRELADDLARAGDPERKAMLAKHDAEHLAEAWRQAMQPQRQATRAAERMATLVLDRWERQRDPVTGQPYRVPVNARSSLRGLHNADLRYTDLRALVDQATDPSRPLRSRWRWLMGCGWNIVRQRRAEAEQLAGVDREPMPEPGDGG